MFTKGYQDKRGCRAGSPLGLRGESRNCSSTQGEVAGPAPGFGPAYGPGPSWAGEGRAAERSGPGLRGHLSKKRNWGALQGPGRGGGGVSVREGQQVTERPGAAPQTPGHGAFPLCGAVPGKRQRRSRSRAVTRSLE